jgi:hypothetical protein
MKKDSEIEGMKEAGQINGSYCLTPHPELPCSDNYYKIRFPPCELGVKGLYPKPLNNEHYFTFALHPYGSKHHTSFKFHRDVMLLTHLLMCAIWIH